MPDTKPAETSAALDVDASPGKVVAQNGTHVGKDWEYRQHQHIKAQLLYATQGLLHCTTNEGIWLVPSQCAVWIPSQMPHSVYGSSGAECYCLYVDQETVPELPRHCCTLAVSPLLREMLIKVAGFPSTCPRQGPEERLISAMLDELAAAPVETLYLPMPSDRRLRRFAQQLLGNPADKASKAQWASRIGMSERSMSRLLHKEIGMSFVQWRRQVHIMLSLQRLTAGESVQSVATAFGYESASGFVAMFRKTVGQPPARYLAQRQQNRTAPAACPPIALPDLDPLG